MANSGLNFKLNIEKPTLSELILVLLLQKTKRMTCTSENIMQDPYYLHIIPYNKIQVPT